MICDKLSNLPLYRHVIRDSEAVLAFLRSNDLSTLEKGRHDIPNTDEAYVNVMDFTTRLAKDAQWESHNVYIDIHIPFAGEEIIQWTTTDQLSQSNGYMADNDAELYNDTVCDCGGVLIQPGYFCICLPHDAHAPGLSPNAPTTGRKAVVKVKVL